MIYEHLFKGGQLTIAVSAEKCYIVNSDEATNSIVAPNTLNENLKPNEKQNYQLYFAILLQRCRSGNHFMINNSKITW